MLALIAGRGRLPAAVAAAVPDTPLICALDGFAPAGLTPDITFRLETLGSFLLELGNRGVTDLCLCGSIDRPELDPAKLDAETAPLVPILMQAMGQGDDGALRAVMLLLEKTGFTIRAAHELAPDILPPEGVLTKRAPRGGHHSDAQAGVEVLRDMARADLGQACVIRKGVVIAREDEAGTDAMLTSLALPHDPAWGNGDPLSWAFDAAGALVSEARDWLSGTGETAHDAPGAGAVLFKAPKPGQDLRADLPTIGPVTAMRAAEAGLDGIVIQSGGVIALDLPQILQILDAMGMFLWVRP